MRPIKFRAWCPNMKAMIDVSTLHISETNPWVKDSFDGFAKNFELMQFTGLLDRNGREIYEGDIVKRGFPPLDQNITVIFKDGAYVGEQIGPSVFVGNTPCVFVLRAYLDECEIIGNIYESPELLKGGE